MTEPNRKYPDTGNQAESMRRWAHNARHLARNGLYNPASEHAACGVGFVAAVDGQPSRRVVDAGIEALQAVWHRGAVDADGKTGDGAGIHVQIPLRFFKEHIARTGHEPERDILAVGMIFLPRTDYAAQEACRVAVESEILRRGYRIYGWRQVPVNTKVTGAKANATRPEIEQIMLHGKDGADEDAIERDLYGIRRRIEKRIAAKGINDFYICSLSCRSLIYKGMFLAEQLSAFYPDLDDPRFESNFAIFHQRYSTNTFPTWRLAQPFRMLAHNGEINTVKGNINWMQCHEVHLAAEALGERAGDIKPIVQQGSSDSAALDAAFELLVQGGRSAPLAKMMLIPESLPAGLDTTFNPVPQSDDTREDDAITAMLKCCNSIMEPWDGPASIAGYDGTWVIAGMDRNGLRPLRYLVTEDGLFFAGSETGMVALPEHRIVEKGRVGPGEMIAVNSREGGIFRDADLKKRAAAERPFQKWAKKIHSLDSQLNERSSGGEAPEDVLSGDRLRRRQIQFGYTHEEIELILHPMTADAKEPTGSMGDDTPIAVLSGGYRGLHHYFRQQFSQVTNPPIDSLREYRVMSLATRFGNFAKDLADPDVTVFELESPVLTTGQFAALRRIFAAKARTIHCTFSPETGPRALLQALQRIIMDAEDAVRSGIAHLILTDEDADAGIGSGAAAVPMILAVGAVHAHLMAEGLRGYASLHCRSAECLDVHYHAVLIGVGATTVNAYLAEASIRDRHARGLLPEKSAEESVLRYKRAIDQGLLKIMSKMGIAVLGSYRGAYNFEAVGLSRTLVDRFFPGMQSRLSGIGVAGIQRKVVELHNQAAQQTAAVLPIGGLYRYRRHGEAHAFDGPLIHLLQEAVSSDSYTLYRKFSAGIAAMPPLNLRDLLAFKPMAPPVSVDAVESITQIRKRFVTGAMSHGALSREAHETLAIAMNRIGAKSDSGEGGEAAERFSPRANGDNASSAIKQVASGRFGVTAAYLNKAVELEIKIAQGAKPGEGGQLPGFKVTAEIATLRHATPGVTLISPPPHHDIYSIEDLAQLIYDLKQINPDAKVSVKLVSESGIGTIAAGVAKAKADVIMISGHSGGTGASPQSSIKYAGTPWEMGLSEVNQVLTLNNLRENVVLRTDGAIKTGRDVVIAAMLGAEEFGLGTAGLVAMGCILVRQCHSNTCPVGICTQNEKLREKFEGTADKVVNLVSFIAEEVRELLAELGATSLNDIIGRSDLLMQVKRGADDLDDLDLNPLLAQADAGGRARFCTQTGRNDVPDSLDAQMMQDAQPLFLHGEKMQLQYNIRNVHRAVGARLSSQITRQFGMTGLQPGHVTVRLRGSAGQSLGAFAVQGMKLQVLGDANDYVGKGLSGGTIVIRPTPASPLVSHENTIVGNTVLYGATAGYLYAAGEAGERFAVRNSGATAVVEGVGSNACEYMTGGVVVILGRVGANFAAGMTGGMAFIYDPDGQFAKNVNPDTVMWQSVRADHWRRVLRDAVSAHVAETQSNFGARLLNDWDLVLPHFQQVCPLEMLPHLRQPLDDTAVNAAGGG